MPRSIDALKTKTFTLGAANVGTGVDVVLNRAARPEIGQAGDTGNLSFSNICVGSEGVGTSLTNGKRVTIRGCASGKATVRLYRTGSKVLLASYPVNVISRATRAPRPTAGPRQDHGTDRRRGERQEISVAGNFSGTLEWYAATSSDDTVAGVSMANADLTITGVKVGSANVTVTANNGRGKATQTYRVTVTAAAVVPPPVNPGGTPPMVNAGPNKRASLGASVYVHGTGSPVDDDDDATSSWTQIDGTRVSMMKSARVYVPNSPGSDSFTFVAPLSSAVLTFQLTVKDLGTGLTASDTMTVTVR